MNRLFTLVLASSIWFGANAQIPGTLSYQGILVNSSGEPLTDGAHTVRFRFYDAVTGGTLLHETAHLPVTTYKGMFTTIIGTGEVGNTELNLDVNNAAYIANKTVYVEISADNVVLNPRVALTTTPNALHAQNANVVPASGITGVLTVPQGGTGVASITGVFIGNGTSAASGLAASSGGQFLRSNATNTGYEFATIDDSGVTPGTYGSTTAVPQITVDAKGRVTSAADVAPQTASTSTSGILTATDWNTFNSKSGSASNGLTQTATDTKLGGALTENTTLTNDGFNLEINGNGKVGIGTGVNDPINKLDVGGAVSIGNAYAGVVSAPANGLVVQGNVGMGTAAPEHDLDIRGNGTDDAAILNVANSDASHFMMLFGGRENDPNPFIAWNTSDPLRLSTFSGDASDFTEHMRIQPDGNVGIGTTTPDNRLSVSGGSVNLDQGETYKIGNETVLRRDDNAVYSGSNFVTPLVFVAGAEVGRFDTDGNLGIGTTTPAATLDVNGTTILRGYTGINRTTPIGSSQFDVEIVAGSGSYGGMYLNGTDASSRPFYGYATASSARAWHYVDGATGSWRLNVNNGDRISVSTTGNLGIGNTAPNAPLQFASAHANRKIALLDNNNNDHQFLGLGTAAGTLRYQVDGTTSAHAFYAGTSISTSNELMRITGTGNVGVGTITVVNKLDVEGGAAIGTTYSGATTAPTNGLIVEGNVGLGTGTVVNKLDVEGGTAIGANYSGSITAPTNGLIVEGNIGAGTTATVNKLDIEGGAAIGALYSGNFTAPANGLLVQGNVGVGTTTVSYPLSVYSTAVRGLNVEQDYSSTLAQTGVYVDMSAATGTNTKYGIQTAVSGTAANSSNNYGYYNLMTPNGTGNIYGVHNIISAVGTGGRYGTSNSVATASGNTSNVYGTENTLTTNNNTTFGTYNNLTSTGTGGAGIRQGVRNVVYGLPSSTGEVYGEYNYVYNYSTGTTYGIFADVNKAASQAGTLYGLNITSDNDGTGSSYLMYANSIGSTTGTEYGLYVTGEDLNYFSGQVGIGVLSPTFKLELPNTASDIGGRGRAQAWSTYSDSRVKSEQRELKYGIKTVMSLRPKSYTHHSSTFENGQLQLQGGVPTIGLIAQEVYNIIPEVVSKPANEATDLWSLDYTKMVPVLIKAIQEQQQQIDALQSYLAVLKQQMQSNAQLAAQVEELKRTMAQMQAANSTGASNKK